MALSGARRAILLVLGSSGLFAGVSALVKVAAREIPTVELMMFRSLIALLLMLPWIVRAGGSRVLRTRRWGGHALRSATGLGGMFGAFYGYAHLPLAAATALGFAMPIFLAVMGFLWLDERVSIARGLSIGAGLAGVLLVVRPWEGAAGLPLFETGVVLAGVVAWAGSMASIRRMGQGGERNLTIVTWFMLNGTVVSALLCVPGWVTPRWEVMPALLGIGALSAAAQMLMTEGYRNGEASVLAPFEYSAIFYTVGMGWVFWAEVPGAWEALGMGVLVGSGLWTWWRETRRVG